MLSSVSTLDMFYRLGGAALIGACVGANREFRRKPAGPRTLALVGVGAAVTALTVQSLGGGPDAVSRAAQGVLTGIGFLGAGVILHHNEQGVVTGLTTAASIWVVAALGITCGVGLERTALIATLVTLIVLVAGYWLERAIQPYLDRTARK